MSGALEFYDTGLSNWGKCFDVVGGLLKILEMKTDSRKSNSMQELLCWSAVPREWMGRDPRFRWGGRRGVSWRKDLDLSGGPAGCRLQYRNALL